MVGKHPESATNQLRHASLRFHSELVTRCLVTALQSGETNDAINCYICLTNFHTLDNVAKTLFEYGLEVLKLRGEEENETEDLLRNLITLKGPYLTKHVKALAKWYIERGNLVQAEALVKSKLKGNEMKAVLVELDLLPEGTQTIVEVD